MHKKYEKYEFPSQYKEKGEAGWGEWGITFQCQQLSILLNFFSVKQDLEEKSNLCIRRCESSYYNHICTAKIVMDTHGFEIAKLSYS